MRFGTFKITATLIMLFLSGGCAVDHTGLTPRPMPGAEYVVDCVVTLEHPNERGVFVITDVEYSVNVCSRFAPSEELMTSACRSVYDDADEQEFFEMNAPGFIRRPMDRVSAVTSRLVEGAEPCTDLLSEDDSEVIGRIDSLLSTPPANGAALFTNEDGRALGENSLTNSMAVIVDSDIRVGAKLLKWRYANTRAQGETTFDRFNCNSHGECDLTLRHVALEFEDFTIERPTVFARDISVKNARLRSLQSYKTRIDSEGRFEIQGLRTLVNGVVDGEQVNIIAEQDLTIKGQFNNYLHDQSHAALTLNLQIDFADDDFSVEANTDLQVHKFPSKLANLSGPERCLVGGVKKTYREARVAECNFKHPFQAWSFEIHGRYLKIRQPLTNTCLNVKSDSQNYDGGIVSIVNCSNHLDQLWAVDQDNNVLNLQTQKCLDVGNNKNRPENDLVTVSTCNSKTESQNWAVRRPG